MSLVTNLGLEFEGNRRRSASYVRCALPFDSVPPSATFLADPLKTASSSLRQGQNARMLNADCPAFTIGFDEAELPPKSRIQMLDPPVPPSRRIALPAMDPINP